jgi:hypothetical protein
MEGRTETESDGFKNWQAPTCANKLPTPAGLQCVAHRQYKVSRRKNRCRKDGSLSHAATGGGLKGSGSVSCAPRINSATPWRHSAHSALLRLRRRLLASGSRATNCANTFQDKTISANQSRMFDRNSLSGFIFCNAGTIHMNSVHRSSCLYDRELRSLFGIPFVQCPRNNFPSRDTLRLHGEILVRNYPVAPFLYKAPDRRGTPSGTIDHDPKSMRLCGIS